MHYSTENTGAHLTASDRMYIEVALDRGDTFRSIARFLNKDPSTISKEVRRSSVVRPRGISQGCQKCRIYHTCTRVSACGNEACRNDCRTCPLMMRRRVCCDHFKLLICQRAERAPYVCNGCEHDDHCPLKGRRYNAAIAQKKYEKTLVSSRSKPHLSKEEMRQLDKIISPLVMNGQPLCHIFETHKDEIPCTRRTIYNYFEHNEFTAKNIDLPRRVRYKKRKPKNTTPRDNQNKNIQAYRSHRTYRDFLRYMENNPNAQVVELDTVKGTAVKGKCLLTLFFRCCALMLVFLLPDCKQSSVIHVFDKLSILLGEELFKQTFQVILTDNGPEFKDAKGIEQFINGEQRTKVFYCDPYVSNQKSRLEKNHEYIRYVIPKGKSMNRYTQEDISLMASHINSIARDSLNGKSPYDLAELLINEKVLEVAGIVKIAPDQILLKPELIIRK